MYLPNALFLYFAMKFSTQIHTDTQAHTHTHTEGAHERDTCRDYGKTQTCLSVRTLRWNMQIVGEQSLKNIEE